MRMRVRRCSSVVLCCVVESATEAVVAVLMSWLAVAAYSAVVAGMAGVEEPILAVLC